MTKFELSVTSTHSCPRRYVVTSLRAMYDLLSCAIQENPTLTGCHLTAFITDVEDDTVTFAELEP